MLTKHSGVQAGDEQGKARNAAVVTRWALKVRCERGSVPDGAFMWHFPERGCVISVFAGLRVMYQCK